MGQSLRSVGLQGGHDGLVGYGEEYFEDPFPATKGSVAPLFADEAYVSYSPRKRALDWMHRGRIDTSPVIVGEKGEKLPVSTD